MFTDNPYFGLTTRYLPIGSRSTTARLLRTAVTTSLRSCSPRTHSRELPRGSILIAAEDLFFTPTQADDALQLINYTREQSAGGLQGAERRPASQDRRSFFRPL